jgi:hypothetical protein
MVHATLTDVQLLSNASNWMKWTISSNAFATKKGVSPALVGDMGEKLIKIFEQNDISSSDFDALYTEIKSYFSIAAID